MERKKLTEYQNIIGYIITELYSKIDFYIFNIETEYDYISIFNFRLGKLYIIKLNIFDSFKYPICFFIFIKIWVIPRNE